MSISHEIPMALRVAYLSLHRRSEAAFAPFGVTADQFVLLAKLAHGGQALTQRELARRISSDPSTVRAMLVLLEQRGFVDRETHPTDARKRTVALTADGRQMFERLWTVGEPIRASIQGDLTAAEGELLVSILERVAHSLAPTSVPLDGNCPSHSPEVDHDQSHRGTAGVRPADRAVRGRPIGRREIPCTA